MTDQPMRRYPRDPGKSMAEYYLRAYLATVARAHYPPFVNIRSHNMTNNHDDRERALPEIIAINKERLITARLQRLLWIENHPLRFALSQFPRLAALHHWLTDWPQLSTWWTITRLRAALVTDSVLIALKIR